MVFLKFWKFEKLKLSGRAFCQSYQILYTFIFLYNTTRLISIESQPNKSCFVVVVVVKVIVVVVICVEVFVFVVLGPIRIVFVVLVVVIDVGPRKFGQNQVSNS